MAKKIDISPDLLKELDKKLQEMALVNFEVFCKMAGVDRTQAFVCFEIARGKSMRAIAMKIKIGKSTVHLIKNNCPDLKDIKKGK